MAKHKGDVEKEIVTKLLTFKLSTAEIADKGRMAADARTRLNEKNREFDDVKMKYKGQIGTLELEISAFLGTIKKGTEERSVECTMIRDYARHVVQFLYPVDGVDTVMEERAMTLEERQPELLPTRPRSFVEASAGHEA